MLLILTPLSKLGWVAHIHFTRLTGLMRWWFRYQHCLFGITAVSCYHSPYHLVLKHVLWLQFTSTLEANILKAQGVVANCTVTKVEAGSIKVSSTIAFPGADEEAAKTARDSVATALSSASVADYFGTSFGEVTVSNVQATTSANPSSKLCCIPNRCSQICIINN